jgi:hypothetical protein
MPIAKPAVPGLPAGSEVKPASATCDGQLHQRQPGPLGQHHLGAVGCSVAALQRREHQRREGRRDRHARLRSTSLGVVFRPLAGGGTVVGATLATAGGSTGGLALARRDDERVVALGAATSCRPP